jgi:NAD(P)-dependent dehydrogenase (short-subunit alcohol dehydrogenase family)
MSMQTLDQQAPDLFSVAGQHVLITGASGGLGAHFARFLAGRGAKISLAARRVDRLTSLVAEITGAGGQAQALELDVANPASVTLAIGQAESGFGPLNALINNAGITRSGAALDLSEDDWQAVIDTNLSGVWYCAQQAARHMAKHGGGTVVNIASILGERVAGGVAPYAASKAAVLHLTKALALEWARYGVRVNALAPGYVETDLNRDFFASPAGLALIKRIPQRRLGQPQDLDGPLLLLISAASAAMTGAVLAVDGGHLVSSL